MGPVGTLPSRSVSSQKDTAIKQEAASKTAGEAITSKKKHNKLTAEQVKIIKQHLPDVDAKKMRLKDIKALLEKKGSPLSEITFSDVVKKIRNGIDPLISKTRQKITAEIIEGIREELPKLEKGKKKEKVAEKFNISLSALQSVLNSFETGRDLSIRKKPTKTTDELVKQVKEIAFELEAAGKPVTQLAIANRCGITATHARNIMIQLEKNKNPVNKGPKIGQKATAKIDALFKEACLLFQQGKLTSKEAADKCGISQKAFEELQNKEKTGRKAATDKSAKGSDKKKTVK